MSFASDERLVAVGGDDANSFMVWDLGSGECVFRGSAGATPVYLVRAIYGWADSGGNQGAALLSLSLTPPPARPESVVMCGQATRAAGGAGSITR